MPTLLRRHPNAARNPPPNALEHQTTHVYGLYNHTGELIYIGIANNLARRWQRHKATKPWIGEVRYWREIARYPTRSQAKAHETWVITNTPTRWNIDESPIADQVCQRYRDLGYQPGTNLPLIPLPRRPLPLRLLHALGWLIVQLLTGIGFILWLAWIILTFTLRLAYDLARTLGAPLPHLTRRRHHRPQRHRKHRRN